MFGRFLEIALTSPGMVASVQFYERLGFAQLTANDTWTHPYGVLTDGRLCIGLHHRSASDPSPLLTFVQPDLAKHARLLEQRGFKAESAQLGEGAFHQLRLRDPAGQAIALLEARTFSPALGRQRESLCGWFSAYSMPSQNDAEVSAYWERAGFVALDRQDQPLPLLPLVSDHLSLALHAARDHTAPLLVFVDPQMAGKLAALEAAGIERSPELPRGLNRRDHALLEAPEGTRLLLLTADP